MKVRLLKKVRKRYEIVYHPHGTILYDRFWDGPIWTLEDSHNSWRTMLASLNLNDNLTPEEYLFQRLLEWIRRDYKYTRKSDKRPRVVIWPK